MENPKGFTLVETIVAIMLITIIASMSFNFLWFCQNATLVTERKLMAINFARDTIEEVYWETPANLPPAVQNILLGNTTANITYEVDNTTSNDYEIINVTVNWED